jgi:NTP pyrophosphatase (non-canonical NTP hydrolase)
VNIRGQNWGATPGVDGVPTSGITDGCVASDAQRGPQRKVVESIARLVEIFHLWAFSEQFGEGTNNPGQRIKLHTVEHAELIEALEDDDLWLHDRVEYLTRVAHELADNAWLIYGSAHSLGIPLDAVLRALYQSHRTRVDDNGDPFVNEDNKVIKTANYQSPLPAIRQIIRDQLELQERITTP